jgi:hypothetical protein
MLGVGNKLVRKKIDPQFPFFCLQICIILYFILILLFFTVTVTKVHYMAQKCWVTG